LKKVLFVFIFLSSFVYSYEELNIGNFDQKIKGKNVIVDFYAVWCKPCKLIAQNLVEFDELKEKDVTIYKVNVDKEYFLASKYQVNALPSLLLFKDGKLIKKTIGLLSTQQILELSEKQF
jgi:thioredoxin 1